MTKIYICCNDNRREVYEEKVRKYLVNAYVANTIEESTDAQFKRFLGGKGAEQ